jgi:23S rRNA (uracil1939-C5)-methyltransferase
LQPSPSNEIRNATREYAIAHDYSFFDLKKQEGLLRNLIIRTTTTEEVMVALVFAYNDDDKIAAMLQHLQQTFSQITSLLYVINNKRNDTIYDCEVIHYAGNDYITETMDGLHFRIGLKSFFQTNTAQAEQLYEVVRSMAALTGKEVVYDLYCGTGTIGCYVARQAKRIVGIEIIPEAIADARTNAQINAITNADFVTGDMKDMLSSAFADEYGTPDVVIIDPPRAGLHVNVVNALLQMMPPRIVYVSCNPATQARDIAMLSAKYRLACSQPVDMFPHTHHVENVALLELGNDN